MITLKYHGYSQDELETLLLLVTNAIIAIRCKNKTCNCDGCFRKNLCHDLNKLQSFIQDLLYSLDTEHIDETTQNGG